MTKNLLLITLLVIFLVAIVATERGLYPKNFDEVVSEASETFRLPEHLIYAIIKVESDNICNAVSSKGAMGLMQIMPSTAVYISGKKIEDLDLFDPYTNIMLGSKYIRMLLDKYDDNIELALAAYNGGQGNVDKWLNASSRSDFVALYTETRNYLTRVLLVQRKYKEIYSKEFWRNL